MKIFTISGHARSGKDTVAKMLRDALEAEGSTVLIAHYGDLVKYICRTFFDWDGNKDEYGRTLLQYCGTDVIRKADPDYWVRFIIQILRFFPDTWDYVIIPDARFPNEIRALQDENFSVVHLRVERPNFDNGLTDKQKAHPSETSLDHTEPDAMILNDGTLEHLEMLVGEFVKENVHG